MEQRPGQLRTAFMGIFVCAALAAGSLGVLLLGQRDGWFSDPIELTTSMEQVHGLRTGTRVRVLGIPVGQVSRIEPPATPGEPVRVHFWIEEEYQSLIRTDATVELVKEGFVGERVLEINPGTAEAAIVADGAELASRTSPTWEELMQKANQLSEQIAEGQGTLGKLIQNPEAYESLEQLLGDARNVLSGVDENLSSLKQSWPVKGWFSDRYDILVRPEAETFRKIFAEEELFEAGRAILTDGGRAKLDEVATWIHDFDHHQSDVVVAGFAADMQDGRLADLMSQKQAEAVLEYLTYQHGIQRTGWLTRRTADAHGFGNLPAPDQRKDLPARRIEILTIVE
ncbi:MlaD family protein [Kolteria novifilia]